MFTRIRYLLAAFDRLEFDEAGLSARLERYLATNSREPCYSRKPTHLGPAPVLWGEP
jgi:hypothetical protein